AESWLEEFNHNNRGIKKRISAYVADMKNGDWKFNGESIKFSDRFLEDGQHRLHAIVQSGVAQDLLVVRGLGHETQDTMDDGIPRKFHDKLALHKVPHASLVASIVRKIATWQR